MKTLNITICIAVSALLTSTQGCFKHFAHERAVDMYVSALSLRSAALDEDAVAQLEEAVRLDDEFSLAHSMLGDLRREQGDYEGAAEAYESACRLDPWAFRDHFNLGEVYKILKRFADAIEAFKRACQLQPEHAQANFSLGMCYYETEDYDQAARFCQRAVELEPQNDQILASLGAIYGKAGDDHKAIRAYKQALEINSSDEQVMIKLGLVYVRMKRFDPARLILNKAVAAAPDNSDTHLNLAYCLFVEREVESALQSYRKVLELDEKQHKAYNGIAACSMMMYLADRENVQACRDGLEHWHRSLEMFPEQPRIRKLVAKYTQQLYPASESPILQP